MENNQSPSETGQPTQPETPTPHSPTGGEKVIQPLSQDLQPAKLVNPAPAPVQSSVVPPPTPPPVSSEPTTPEPNTPASTANDPYVGLTGSQMQLQKQPLPVGVYIIAAFNLIGFVTSFFDSSQNSGLFTVAMLFDLLLAIGLLLRLEIARKLIMWLSALILILTTLSLILLVGLQQRVQQAKTNYNNAISRIDQTRLTTSQRQQLDSLQSAVSAQEKKAGKAIAFSYIKLGVTALETIAVMVYLTRPKVQAAFHELEA